MEFSRSERGILILILLTVLCSLFVLGGIDRPPAPEMGVYPGAEKIAEQPNRYQNQQVSFGAQVVSTDPVVVEAEYGTDTGIKSIRLEITGIATTVEHGDRLQIFGVLTGPGSVRALNIVAVPQTGRWYAWVISAVAGLWVLARLFNQWTVDSRTGAVCPRSQTVTHRVLRGDD